MVEHTVRGNVLHITKVNKNLYGELLKSNDEVFWRFYPHEYNEEIKGSNYTIRESYIPGDVFSVRNLLDATGFSLDGNFVS